LDSQQAKATVAESRITELESLVAKLQQELKEASEDATRAKEVSVSSVSPLYIY